MGKPEYFQTTHLPLICFLKLRGHKVVKRQKINIKTVIFCFDNAPECCELEYKWENQPTEEMKFLQEYEEKRGETFDEINEVLKSEIGKGDLYGKTRQ